VSTPGSVVLHKGILALDGVEVLGNKSLQSARVFWDGLALLERLNGAIDEAVSPLAGVLDIESQLFIKGKLSAGSSGDGNGGGVNRSRGTGSLKATTEAVGVSENETDLSSTLRGGELVEEVNNESFGLLIFKINTSDKDKALAGRDTLEVVRAELNNGGIGVIADESAQSLVISELGNDRFGTGGENNNVTVLVLSDKV
jgi:hypothetical protein